MSNLLTLLQSSGIEPRRASVANGGEYQSACPLCGDGGKGKGSDRFHIWPDKPAAPGGLCSGRFWCRVCGEGGDTIAFLMKIKNMSFPEACADLGIILPNNQKIYYQRPATPEVPRENQFIPKVYPEPPELWSKCASAFLADCQARLRDRPDARAWLVERGIDTDIAITYGLGYNESSKGKDRYRPRDRWGLPDKTSGTGGKNKKLWLPRGWVIPMFGDAGRVLQLRIRRRDEDIAAFAPEIRYLVIDGSSHGTMVLHQDALALAVVESGLDAILIAGQFTGEIGAVTTWNASARPDARATQILHRAICVLDCLDFDKAGIKEGAWWRENFRRVKRWPTPIGKDPGDAYKAGADIRQWIIDGLPAGLALRFGGDTSGKNGEIAGDLPRESTEKNPDTPPTEPANLPRISGLKWCSLCYGDKFFHPDAGGYFCVDCMPTDKPGSYVLATVPRAEYVVD